jgi:uncharacterized protein YaiL (DUF2058 family)
MCFNTLSAIIYPKFSAKLLAKTQKFVIDRVPYRINKINIFIFMCTLHMQDNDDFYNYPYGELIWNICVADFIQITCSWDR